MTDGAVSQWMRRQRDGGGVQALHRRLPPGPAPKLTTEQRAQIPILLALGAEAYGFIGAVWTQRRMAALIQRQLHVRYHPASLTRLLRQIGWSPRDRKPAPLSGTKPWSALGSPMWPALSAKPSVSSGPSSS